MKKRKNPFGSWQMVKDLSQPDFWQAMCQLYNIKKDGRLTYKKAASLIYRSHSRMQKWFAPGGGQQPLSMADRHHLYLAIQYAPQQKTPRKKYPKRRIYDRLGTIMSSLKEQHQRVTGQKFPMTYWEKIAKEKIETEDETGVRHMVLRDNKNLGFTLDNIYLHQVKSGKKLLSDWD
jgi:hypothetical protein